MNDDRRVGVEEINTLLLGVTLDNYDFIHVGSVIVSEFLLEYPFASYRFASWR